MKNVSCTRKSHRLKGYNYSSNGSYFITICVKNKECLLGEIVGVDAPVDPVTSNINDIIYHKATNAKMILSPFGKTVEKYIESSKTKSVFLSIDNYVIMPNHIHFIITITNNEEYSSPTPQHHLIPQFVSTLKSLVTREIGFSAFQRDYHDHIIRNEKEYEKISDYIDTNVSQWVTDRFYMY